MKLRFFISPFFVNKWYLYKQTKIIIENFIFEGDILDIGCGVKPYKSLFKNADKYVGIDFKNFSKNNTYNYEKPDFFFNKEYRNTSKIQFKNGSFDHTVAFQVLEHHNNPLGLIKEMYRITKPGGLIFLSVPFMGGIHEDPHDYQRFTKFGLKLLFEKYKCKILTIDSYGSIASTVSTLLNEDLCNFANRNRTTYIISLFLYPPFLILQYLSLFVDLFVKSDHIVRGYLILVKKL